WSLSCWGTGVHTGGRPGTGNTGAHTCAICWRAAPKLPPRGTGQKIDESPWSSGPLSMVLWAAGTLPSKSGWVGDGESGLSWMMFTALARESIVYPPSGFPPPDVWARTAVDDPTNSRAMAATTTTRRRDFTPHRPNRPQTPH